MKLAVILVLTLVTYQAPTPTFIKAEGVACKTPSLWYNYMVHSFNKNYKELRFLTLSQRCVYQPPGKVKVLARNDKYVMIEGKDKRHLYVPDGYLIE